MKILKILLCYLLFYNFAIGQTQLWSKAPEGGLIYYGVFGEAINYKFESSIDLDIQKFNNVHFTKVKESQKKIKLNYNNNDELITERIDNQEKLFWLINRLYGYNMLNAFKANLEKKEIYDFYSTDAEEEIMKQSAKGKHIYIMNNNLIYAIPGFPVKEVSEFRLTSKDEQFLKNLCTEIDVLYCIPFKAIEYLFPDSLKNNQLKIEDIRNILAYNTNEKFTSEIKNLFFKNFLKSIINDEKSLNDMYLQGELFKFYICKASSDLKDIYIEHIIFLLKNNIKFYNNLEESFCQGHFSTRYLWNELWQNKIQSNKEYIKLNYITDLMLFQAANQIRYNENNISNYLYYFKKNNLLSNV